MRHTISKGEQIIHCLKWPLREIHLDLQEARNVTKLGERRRLIEVVPSGFEGGTDIVQVGFDCKRAEQNRAEYRIMPALVAGFRVLQMDPNRMMEVSMRPIISLFADFDFGFHLTIKTTHGRRLARRVREHVA
jgi:hypothetical protein